MPKVLFVDDEPYILDTYVRMLRNSAFECFILSNSSQVFEYLNLKKLDIIVVDQQMPRFTGSEILSQVKQSYPDIKGVLVSGDIHGLQDSSCDIILQKPLTKLGLLNSLLSLL